MDYIDTWPRCPEAARLFDDAFHDFIDKNPIVSSMSARFLEGAGVDLRNLIDHWGFPDQDGALAARLTTLGFAEGRTVDGDPVWHVPGARLPRVRLSKTLASPRMGIAVDDVAHFLRSNALAASTSISGEPDSALESVRIPLTHGELVVLARRGYDGFRPGEIAERKIEALHAARGEFLARSRAGDDRAVIAAALEMFQRHASIIGEPRAVDEFFAAERSYYVTRNRAAQWIYKQQKALGFGWANHDHHTYRSSRDSLYDLTNLWHAMGFVSREQFYAGAEAGWGAQVLEHPISRVVIFADVDLAPNELEVDYEAKRLPARDTLGTIGLWCALHGSSIAEAGMHHIECEYDFDAASRLFAAKGFFVMKPFTDLPMLKQRFTQPELWRVPEDRLRPLVASRILTEEQAEVFRTQGAPGSHIEILQRWEGFKGFNKTGVSSVIKQTDARNRAIA